MQLFEQRTEGAGTPMDDPQKLRELAAWYREFAEKTANPAIWESRLRMAEDLEQEASRMERRQPAAPMPVSTL
jgi:hypothetical protein